MIHLRVVIFATVAVLNIKCEDDSWKNNVEYFERVDLDCAKFNFNKEVIQSVQAWILPSGDVWKHGADLPGRHIIVRDNGLVLTIERLEDDDFGVYFCIVDTGPNGTHVIKIGVNVDGPYFGPTYLKEIKHSAMIGGIAAGCVLVLLIILWLVCAYCTKPPVSIPIQNVHSAPETLNDGQSNEAMKMTQIGSSVYYIADEVAEEKPRSSTSSGDYHSIDSIDRNKNSYKL